jgi:acetyl-CoA acetyltransferase
MNIRLAAGNSLPGGSYYETSWQQLGQTVMAGLFDRYSFEQSSFDAVYISSMLATQSTSTLAWPSLLSDILPPQAELFVFSGHVLSGGTALRAAITDLQAGRFKQVLVLGIDQASVFQDDELKRLLGQSLHPDEGYAGLTVDGAYAMMARAYLEKFSYEEAELARCSIFNHRQAMTNRLSMFRKELTAENIIQSALVAAPLRVMHCAPVVDGASALVLTADDKDKRGLTLVGQGLGRESLELKSRKSTVESRSTKDALASALSHAKIKLEQIDRCEVQDTHSIDMVLALEAMGLSAPGEALRDLAAGRFDAMVNTCGSLKACGNALGAAYLNRLVYVLDAWENPAAGLSGKTILTHTQEGSGYQSLVQIWRAE